MDTIRSSFLHTDNFNDQSTPQLINNQHHKTANITQPTPRYAFLDQSSAQGSNFSFVFNPINHQTPAQQQHQENEYLTNTDPLLKEASSKLLCPIIKNELTESGQMFGAKKPNELLQETLAH